MTGLLRKRYELLDVVGSGGEGRVVRALDHQHDRFVALKIRPAAGDGRREDVLREARILFGLTPHPGLPVVREDFFDNGEYVVAMDWVDGTDLGRLVAERGDPGLPAASVLRYLAQAAEALTHLHTHDPPVVHGDVKPSNLVLGGGGRVVLVDFGVSSSPSSAAPRAGTPGFVAPEVAAGDAPTRASDIYSLAATAHALLTGAPPRGEAPALGGLDTTRAGAIEAALRLGLSTDPKRRPASAGELVERLRAGWEADLPTGALTFCLTDIEGSTRLWDEHPDAMARALVRHDAIVAEVVEKQGGRLIRSMGEGDSTFSVFQDPRAAVRAMVDLVKRLDAERWPAKLKLRVRAGIHTGEAELRSGDYFGGTINRAARLRELAEGGQIFLSQVTADLVAGQLRRSRMALVDLGRHTLRGLQRPENVFALHAPGIRTPPAMRCPFRGLLAFGPDDNEFFFGRERVVNDLVSRLKTAPLVAVIGASGSGKSSVVGAGLATAIAEGGLKGISRVARMTPGANPYKELAALRVRRTTALIVDQFEELFTLCNDAAERSRFVDAMLTKPGRVVVAVRADFYGECAQFHALARAMSANHVLLGPMQTDDLRRAIELPAKRAGLRLEAGLVDVVLRDVAGEPGALPLFSHALLETWERRDGRTLTLEGYREAGGVKAAIARTADREFEDLDSAGQAVARRIFLRLTQLGEGTEDTRRRAARSELRWSDAAKAEVDAVVHRLAEARLITVDENTVEVAHEALIREWPQLRTWLSEDREGLRIQRHLSDAARAWDDMGREPGELYRGARLAAAVEWVGEGTDLNPVESEFLAASRSDAERERLVQERANRRLRTLLAGAAVLLVLALIAGSVALVQRSSARRAATRAVVSKLAAQSREVSKTNPALGLLLAVEAHRHADSVESRGAMLGALAAHPRLVTQLYGVTSNVAPTEFSPDGKLLVAVTNNEAVFYDAATYRTVGPVIHSEGRRWYSGTFTPDGRLLALPNDPGNVELWDVATRNRIGELRGPDKLALNTVRFSPDGRIAATGPVDVGRVTFFDMRTRRAIGAPVEVRPKELGGVHEFAFSPDGRTLAVPGVPGKVVFIDTRTHRPSAPALDIGEPFAEGIEYLSPSRVIIGGSDGVVAQWDLKTHKRVGPTMSVGKPGASAPTVSPDGRFVTSSTDDGRTFVWEIATGEQFGPVLQADTQQYLDTSWSPDGKTLVTAHSRSVAVWDMTGKQALGTPVAGNDDVVLVPAYSPDGKLLALGKLKGEVELRDVGSGRTVARFETAGDVQSVAFSPNGKLLAVAGTDTHVRLWDVSAKKLSGAPLDLGKAWGWDVAFSPNGKVLAVGIDPNGLRDFFVPDVEGAALLFDVATHKRIGKPMVPGKGNFGVLSLAFSPDGKLLATGSFYYRTQLWDVATQRKHGRAMDVADEGVPGVAFSPDGRRVAASGFSGVVRVWDVATQRPAVAPLEGQSQPATGVRFSPNGRFLADATVAGATRLWDGSTGVAYGEQELVAGDKPGSSKVSLEIPRPVRAAFSPDSRSFAVGGIDTLATVWNADPATWPATACRVAGRNLTKEEWNRFLPGEKYRRTCTTTR